VRRDWADRSGSQAQEIWAALPEHAVVVLDRGFCSYALFHVLATPDHDGHWIVRATTN